MSVESFVDTNVFIYQLEGRDARKAALADALIFEALASGTACISFQVVQECLNTIRRKAEIPLDVAGTRRYLDSVLAPLWRVMPTTGLYERALRLQDRHRFSFYDSLIISAALGEGCRRLYTEDLQHGQQIDGLLIENPFRDQSSTPAP